MWPGTMTDKVLKEVRALLVLCLNKVEIKRRCPSRGIMTLYCCDFHASHAFSQLKRIRSLTMFDLSCEIYWKPARWQPRLAARSWQASMLATKTGSQELVASKLATKTGTESVSKMKAKAPPLCFNGWHCQPDG